MSPKNRHERGCLFCLDADGGFLAREHILPEGICGDALVLEPGWVCDRCNHGVLSQLDQELLNLPPIALARLLLGKRLKGGRAPSLKWQNAQGAYDADQGHAVISMTQKTRTWVSDDGQEAKITMHERQWGKTTRQRASVGRALWKMALEVTLQANGNIAYDHGFDDLRLVVLGAVPATGWFALKQDTGPPVDVLDLTAQGTHVDGRPVLIIVANVFGSCLFTEILHRDASMAASVQAALAIEIAETVTF